MWQCFDLTRCPLSSGFPVFFYETSKASWILDGNGFGYRSEDPETACLYVAFVDLRVQTDFKNDLRFWRGDGRNHVLIDARFVVDGHVTEVDVGKAIVASSSVFDHRKFRPRFDLALPSSRLRMPSTGWI